MIGVSHAISSYPIMVYSARGQCPPGHVGANFRDVLKMYLEKHTITYSYFHVQSNKICIIVSTDVPSYPKTSPGKIYVLIVCQVLSSVVPGGKNSQFCSTGNVPQNFFPGKTKFDPTEILPKTIVPGDKIHSDDKIHSNAKTESPRQIVSSSSMHHQ